MVYFYKGSSGSVGIGVDDGSLPRCNAVGLSDEGGDVPGGPGSDSGEVGLLPRGGGEVSLI